MQIVSSYGVELRKQNIPIRQTLEIYRSAVSYLTEIYEQVWEELEQISDSKRCFNAAEHLVHTTKKNFARFDFDLRFPKMPSYLRRAAIQHALGSVSSYETRMDLWEKAFAPTLEKRHHKYFLRFSYTEEVTLTKTPVKEQIICSVDLGINTDAVCTIMRADGTVLGRKFINHPSEKDRMYRTLGRIRRFQREHGSAQSRGRWAYTKRLNTEMGRKIAGAIVKYAEENHADVIVFEYLEMQGKISGKKKQKLHLWRKRDIQKRCEHQAHRKGMRISRVCAWNTSRLAYDGSGSVSRDPKNHSLCVFQTGKRYNCDLSASYNIGARYFIRELLKPLPATERSLLEAKVPVVKRRTSCVYADLRELHLQMEILKAA